MRCAIFALVAGVREVTGTRSDTDRSLKAAPAAARKCHVAVAGWSPAELGEFARAVFLAPGKLHPTAASYQYTMESLRPMRAGWCMLA